MLLTTTRLSKVLQLTLAVIKPDAVAHPLMSEALHQIILENKFVIVRNKELAWRRQDSEKFYAEHSERFFYQRLVEFMSRKTLVIFWNLSSHSPLQHNIPAAIVYKHLDDSSSGRELTLGWKKCIGPMRAYILAKEDGIRHWRDLMGPTKVFRARYTSPTSLRAQFGLTDTRNTTHGSDSPESARREICFFFPDFHVEEWMDKDEPLFRSGRILYDLQKQIHTVSAPS